MPFLSPNQPKHWREKYHIPWTCLPQAHLGVFQLCLWLLIAPGYLGGGLPCLSSALWCQYPKRQWTLAMSNQSLTPGKTPCESSMAWRQEGHHAKITPLLGWAYLSLWLENYTRQWNLPFSVLHIDVVHFQPIVCEMHLVTLRAKLSGAVYCDRSCLFATGAGEHCVFVALWVCYHDNSKLRASIFTKLGL